MPAFETRRRLKRWLLVFGILTFCILFPAFLFSGQILWALGTIQVNAGVPSNADMIVVLGGDYSGHRILKAAELAREGYAPQVLVSGAGSIYGYHESAFAVNFAADHGYSRDLFVPFMYPARSTAEEAAHVVPELRRRGVRRYLIVTSPNHTARAGAMFRRAGPDLELHMVASNDPVWRKGDWWKRREGRKLWFAEETKTVAEYFGF
jgi:uncharacterized SAM-binding protein YcdF (DUF218 family)